MTPSSKITRDDLEAKLRQVAGEVDDTVEDAKPRVLAGAVAGGLLVLLLVYLMGRRGGRNRSAVVEIRRV